MNLNNLGSCSLLKLHLFLEKQEEAKSQLQSVATVHVFLKHLTSTTFLLVQWK